jgi:hypothetical protein
VSTLDLPRAQGENARTPKISNVRIVNRRSLVASFDIELPPGLVIHDGLLLESHGRRWIGLPSKPYQTKDGRSGWTPLISFASAEARDAFQGSILPLAEAAVFGGAQ